MPLKKSRDASNATWDAALLNLIGTEITWGILLKSKFSKSGPAWESAFLTSPWVMLVYKLTDLILSSRELIFIEYLRCSGHCSEYCTCIDSVWTPWWLVSPFTSEEAETYESMTAQNDTAAKPKGQTKLRPFVLFASWMYFFTNGRYYFLLCDSHGNALSLVFVLS